MSWLTQFTFDSRSSASCLIVLMMVASLAGCSDALDLQGRACPCVDGYYCDEQTQQCVEGVPGDPDAPDAALMDADLLDATIDTGTDADSGTPIPLPCDPGWQFSPDPVIATTPAEITYSDTIGYTNFSFRGEGPSGESFECDHVSAGSTDSVYHWTCVDAELPVHGHWTIYFESLTDLSDQPVVHSTCEFEVVQP